MRGLYAIADADFIEGNGLDPVGFCAAVVSGRPALLQLRAKSWGAGRLLEWLRAVRPLCDAAGVLLICNDRPDLAILSNCDGVHVGQEDLDVASARAVARGLKVGVSTHDEAQLRVALETQPDYVAFGPVFATSSKHQPDPVVGLDGLERARRLVPSHIPLVGIGGIDVSRAPLVAQHADLGSVIAALLPPEGMPGVASRVASLHAALGGA